MAERDGLDQDLIGILMMGITGSGKSATGNSILGRVEFLSRGGASSVTRCSFVGYTEIGCKKLKVVDVPGFNDTAAKSDEDKVRVVTDALTQVLTRFPEGFHVVLLVVSYHQRMTPEAQSSMISLVKFFDEQGFKNNGILVITNGDSFKREHRGTTIQDWVSGNTNMVHRWLYEACNKRCVLFDNITTDETQKMDQLRKLIVEIDKVANTGSNPRYMPSICQFPENLSSEMLKSKQKAIQQEKISCFIGILQDNLYKLIRIPNANIQERRNKIEQLISDATMFQGTPEIQGKPIEDKLSAFVTLLQENADGVNLNDSLIRNLNSLVSTMQNNVNEEREEDQATGESWWSKVKGKVYQVLTSETTWKALGTIVSIVSFISSFIGRK